ncbi:MAG TPA: HupE/UreJ family protein [Gemmatimonadetes bacterium]|nr:HupE/UreJ family protein [Gemmatimonadota bacterium]
MDRAACSAVRRWSLSVGLLSALLLVWATDAAAAHGVAQDDASFFLTNVGAAIGPFMYLGAKHMFTGYDHLLFLVGVLFFLYRIRDVVAYVSLFTLGHSVTLLAGVLWGVQANPFIVDAIIGLSVVYKAFDNMDGFRRFLGFQPNTKIAVLVFGLFHGFGLATTLQETAISQDGLLTNMLSFNVGVEIGQILALMGVLIALSFWRTREGFLKHAFVTNGLLMAGGFMLMGYQIVGFFVEAS